MITTETAGVTTSTSGPRLVQLKDICERITKGSTPTSYGFKYTREGIRFIKAENIDKNGLASTTTDYIDEATNEFLKRSILQERDILFSIAGTIGRVGIIRRADLPANTNQALAIVRLQAGIIEQRYIFYYLKSDAIQKDALSQIVGVGRANLSLTNIGEFAIPLISLDQQRQIVAEIEKQFSRLDEAVANLKRVRANLNRYKAAVLKAAVEGRLIDHCRDDNKGNNLANKPIEVAIDSLDQGWSPQCDNEPSDRPNVWGVIKTTAVQSMRYLESENKRLPKDLKPRLNLELVAGDLLMTRAGPRARVGVVCLVKVTRPHLMLCDKVYRIRCKQDLASPAFLELVLNSPNIVDELNQLKTGISDSGVNLTQKRLRELAVPLPSLNKQERIVAEVERRLSVIEELEAAVRANLTRADRLRQSVLRHAFSGKLS